MCVLKGEGGWGGTALCSGALPRHTLVDDSTITQHWLTRMQQPDCHYFGINQMLPVDRRSHAYGYIIQ